MTEAYGAAGAQKQWPVDVLWKCRAAQDPVLKQQRARRVGSAATNEG